ncbi:hypothetical protein LJK87_04890 [Paenibacillus sp. P25]|nr:hypothetical protein LJK87_04890 [Paenibacillus sp. P25]
MVGGIYSADGFEFNSTSRRRMPPAPPLGIIAFSANSRAHADEPADKALVAGGKPSIKPADPGFMDVGSIHYTISILITMFMGMSAISFFSFCSIKTSIKSVPVHKSLMGMLSPAVVLTFMGLAFIFGISLIPSKEI